MTTTFAVGDMTIHRIIEIEKPFLSALQFFPDLTPELLAENRSWMQPTAMDKNDVLIICIQSYVIRTPHHTILVDTCVGNDKRCTAWPDWHMRSDNAYMRALAAHGLTVNDIDFVMCTHLHVDHVGWNTRLENGRWVPTFPKARYLFAKKEYDHWAELSAQNLGDEFNAKNLVTAFTDSVLPVVEANRADLVSSTYQLGDHVRLLPTPGHTPGHVAILLGRQRDEAVITGDLLHSPLQMRHPELCPRVDYDKPQAIQTRRDFFARYCDSETLCCTTHFPSPSVGRIKRWDKGYRCEMVAT